MIRIAKILAFGLLLFSLACNKDDDSGPSGGADITGTWKLTAFTLDGTTTTVGGGVTLNGTFKSTGKNFNAQVTFNKDGTYTSSGSYTVVLTTTISSQTTTLEEPLNDFFGKGTWKRDGSQLTIISGTETTVAEIVEETSKKLRFKVPLNRTTTDSGFSVTQKGTGFQTIERQ